MFRFYKGRYILKQKFKFMLFDILIWFGLFYSKSNLIGSFNGEIIFFFFFCKNIIRFQVTNESFVSNYKFKLPFLIQIICTVIFVCCSLGCVLWHINSCGLFNAKFCLYSPTPPSLSLSRSLSLSLSLSHTHTNTHTHTHTYIYIYIYVCIICK